jgi:hypothetical protein
MAESWKFNNPNNLDKLSIEEILDSWIVDEINYEADVNKQEIISTKKDIMYKLSKFIEETNKFFNFFEIVDQKNPGPYPVDEMLKSLSAKILGDPRDMNVINQFLFNYKNNYEQALECTREKPEIIKLINLCLMKLKFQSFANEISINNNIILQTLAIEDKWFATTKYLFINIFASYLEIAFKIFQFISATFLNQKEILSIFDKDTFVDDDFKTEIDKIFIKINGPSKLWDKFRLLRRTMVHRDSVIDNKVKYSKQLLFSIEGKHREKILKEGGNPERYVILVDGENKNILYEIINSMKNYREVEIKYNTKSFDIFSLTEQCIDLLICIFDWSNDKILKEVKLPL